MKKQIPGYEGSYSVTDEGGVYSDKKTQAMPNGGVKQFAERLLSQKELRLGYWMVTLYKNGVRNDVFVHRIVCTVFNGPAPTMKHQVNHKDGDKSNNRSENLEWLTAAENIQHSFSELGRKQKTKQIIGIDPKTGLVAYKFDSLQGVKSLGISPTNVSACLHGRLKTSGGLIWEFVPLEKSPASDSALHTALEATDL